MVSKTRKLDIHNLCNEVLVPKTDSHPESPTAYLEDSITGTDYFSMEDRTADEESSFFLDSELTHDDTSDDIALPPSSSSPPNFTSSPCSEESTHSTTSITSTPPAFFSQSTGQYLILEDKPTCLDDLALRLNGPLENRPADLDTIVGTAAEWRWPPTLEIASDKFLVQTISEEPEIFSRIGSPNASNAHLTLEIDNAKYDVGSTIPTGVDPVLLITQDFPQAPDSVQDLSPITFGPNHKLRKPSSFRIVKRAQSYVSSPTEDPASKRPKPHHPFHPYEARRMYARRTASARRADSLNSIDSPKRVKDEARRPNRRKTRLTRGMKMSVPIVAPPADHITGMCINSETLAKLRLKRYLERERDLRLAEPLSSDTFRGRSLMGSEDSESIIKRSQSQWEIALGIGKERRLRAIDWILSVLPPVPVPSAPSESESPRSTPSSSTSSSWTTDDEPITVIHNLYEQLQSSFETRFHACWMFLRYFYLTMSQDTHLGSGASPSRSVSLNSQASSCTEHEGRDLLVWDIAVACLSLSIKLHRDFLDPLLPVYSREYLALSPHRLTHDDLESAHRDVLSTFDYRLGSSPQLLMDEFWFALPSLRNLLDFEGGWETAMRYAWSFLLDAIREPDVKAFPESLLTTVAIIDGIMKALVQRDQACSQSSKADRFMPENIFFGDEQYDHVEGVFCDIQALVELTDVQLCECRLWKQISERSPTHRDVVQH